MQKEISYGAEKRNKHLQIFGEKYPVHETGIIGRSILGKDINYYRLGCGKKHIVAVGAHRGTEYITSAALYGFVDFLSEKVTRGVVWNGINLAFLLQRFTYWIIPCLNPDGVDMNLSGIEKTPLYERQLRMNGGDSDFSAWQANARGVDLSLNYSYRFFENKRTEEQRGIQAGRVGFSGEYPESEPETKSFANLLRTIAPVALVTLHLQGKEIFPNPENGYAARLSQRIAESVGRGVLKEGNAERHDGASGYAGKVLGIPSLSLGVGRAELSDSVSELTETYDSVRKALLFLPVQL